MEVTRAHGLESEARSLASLGKPCSPSPEDTIALRLQSLLLTALMSQVLVFPCVQGGDKDSVPPQGDSVTPGYV